MSNTWEIGDHVQVSLPFGETGTSVHWARVSRIQDPGPQAPDCTVKVLFDDPLLYGGTGFAWVRPDVIASEHSEPVRLKRNILIS